MKEIIRKRILTATLLVTSVYFTGAQMLPEEQMGWKLGVQASSWGGTYSLAHDLKSMDSCKVKYLEALLNMPIGGGIAGNLTYDMNAATRKEVLEMCKESGATLVSIGVVNPDNEKEWRQLFEFAKNMGLQQFATEPAPELIPMIAKLAGEYKINVAIHNHPYPSYYWNPDTLIKYVKGYSKYVGACADLGHWVRAGIDPVEALRKYYSAGINIFELHFKDLDEKPNAAYTQYMRSLPKGKWTREIVEKSPPGPHDVPWGAGISGVDAILEELKSQAFKGLILAEYEWQRGENTLQIAQSVLNLRNKLKR